MGGWYIICNSRFWGQPPFLNLTTMYVIFVLNDGCRCGIPASSPTVPKNEVKWNKAVKNSSVLSQKGETDESVLSYFYRSTRILK